MQDLHVKFNSLVQVQTKSLSNNPINRFEKLMKYVQ